MITFDPFESFYDYMLWDDKVNDASTLGQNQIVVDISSSKFKTMDRNMKRVMSDMAYLGRVFTEAEMTGKKRFLT